MRRSFESKLRNVHLSNFIDLVSAELRLLNVLESELDALDPNLTLTLLPQLQISYSCDLDGFLQSRP